MGLCESKTKKIDSKGTNKKIFLGNNDGKDNILYNINSKYILSHLMANLSQRKLLQMVNYNKKLQNQINIGLNNYKEYSQIEIELKVIPIKAEPKKNLFMMVNMIHLIHSKMINIINVPMLRIVIIFILMIIKKK